MTTRTVGEEVEKVVVGEVVGIEVVGAEVVGGGSHAETACRNEDTVAITQYTHVADISYHAQKALPLQLSY